MRDYPSYCVALKPVDFFLPSEEVDEGAVHRLAAAIARAGMWTTPIPVDRETGIIMDGNHRARAAVLLGLHYLPCVLLGYRDPRVVVTHWCSGEPFCVDSIQRQILLHKKRFPYKTTRHLFAPALPETEIQLGMLRGTAQALSDIPLR
ncbi:ParB N-terminal domain-containing protein [Vogesella indigofera]|uniref:ParB N-terminal domain-containing protein n=1 Tax=Vogesella indigofera TaxID=45465 RepID=UPI00234C3106|nr:ParB N-terminal domain-containing protein [Vogesella indigofera]MDC7703721.1 ParB N-terminal domain-containing protein [Vogesella indigofera]